MFGFNNLTPYNRNQRPNFLESFFNEPFFPFTFGNELKTDIRETDDGYSVKVEIPGASKQDISIDYNEKDVLTVSVNRTEETSEENAGYIRRERHEGTSRREYYLPYVSAGEISAKYDNGILSITLPKNKEKPSGKQIEIE